MYSKFQQNETSRQLFQAIIKWEITHTKKDKRVQKEIARDFLSERSSVGVSVTIVK